MLPDFGDPRIARAVQDVIDTLERKGRDYRNASLEPVKIASDLEPEQRIRSRIDEKLARLKAQPNNIDTVRDLGGCFLLLLAAMLPEISHDNGDVFPPPRTGPDVVIGSAFRVRNLGGGPPTLGGASRGALLFDGE